MSLDLDDRQRAMLQEMGVRVWLPQPAAGVLVPESTSAIKKEAVPALDMGAKAQKAQEVRPQTTAPGPVPSEPVRLTDGLDTMDGAMLHQVLAQCQACQLCSGRRAPVLGGGPAALQADWLVVGEPPDEAEERLGAPFAGQAGQLLDNMLAAVGLRRSGAGMARAQAAYVTNVVKCRPAQVRNPTAQELAVCARYLRREVALVQPKVILALGRFAAQSLLHGSVPEVVSIPLGKLRGHLYHYQGTPVVVSYHPAYLLRNQGDKARAWSDLCLALRALAPATTY